MKKKIITLKIMNMINKFSLVGLGCGICVTLEIDKKYGMAMVIMSMVIYLLTDLTIDETIDSMVQ